MKDLPVYRNRQEILDGLEKNQVIIVESPTGSGKTTQLPIILKEAGYADFGVIGITQPRRIATLSVCDFIRDQLEIKDSYVGYKMRFFDTSDPYTRIKIMTDGILLQELKADPLLEDYSVILVDEAHERSLNIDFILGLLKKIIKQRPEFRVIISSATINPLIFSKFFSNAPIISIHARKYFVETKYVPLKDYNDIKDLNDNICRIINAQLKTEKNLDTLIFLPGEYNIKMCIEAIYNNCDYSKLEIYPLYGRLSKEEQESVFTPTTQGKTKIVVATNIAETSITIDNIKTVIDSGTSKINFYNQKNFTSRLVEMPISQASAKQRQGRAGRTSRGTCWRLYNKDELINRPQYTMEEILRTDLSEVVLRMSDLGIYDFENFPYITKPKRDAIRSAESTLHFINAIDKDRHLTSIGNMMAKFPLVPRHSRVIVESILNYPEVLDQILIAVSFLSTKSPFFLPQGEEDEARMAHKSFQTEYGDFAAYLKIFADFTKLSTESKRKEFAQRYYLDLQTLKEIVHINSQLQEIVGEIGIPITGGGSMESYLCCLSSGLLQYVCMKSGKMNYRTLTADYIYIHPGSAWFQKLPKFILAGEIVETSRIFARTVSPLQESWLKKISPTIYEDFKKIQMGSKKQYQDKKEEKIDQKGKNSVLLYKKRYPLIKGKHPIVQIPLEDIPELFRMHKKAGRKAKNIRATIVYKSSFLLYGEKLFTIFEVGRRLDRAPKIYQQIPDTLYNSADIKELAPNFNKILSLVRFQTNSNKLGFVELLSDSKGNYCYHINKSFFDALENSTYSLIELKDTSNAARKYYERLVRLLDS